VGEGEAGQLLALRVGMKLTDVQVRPCARLVKAHARGFHLPTPEFGMRPTEIKMRGRGQGWRRHVRVEVYGARVPGLEGTKRRRGRAVCSRLGRDGANGCLCERRACRWARDGGGKRCESKGGGH
jgi:hypothetical protein